MHVVFLGSRLPLTKTFLMNSGVLTATPYPHVTRVSSFHEEAATLSDFHALLVKHAALGHCLFNGQLEAPLQDESRAGKTRKLPKEFVVFDFDKVEAKDAADVIARYLPPCCQNVSYIAQLSASMFRPDVKLWSGHIFMLLRTPIDEARLKAWVESINFSVPALEGQIKLSDSLQALHWPLDRTATYNSKLIYIAPPKCHGFTPNVPEPIQLVKRKMPVLDIPVFTPVDNITIRQKINELRKRIGEPEIDYKTVPFDGEEVMVNSGICEVHGIKTSGEHYIRFNLNGGDSYAYFIDLRNPGIIRNFKGEPFLKTEEAAPDLYKSLRKVAPTAVSKAPLEAGTEVLAFYATNQNSAIKVGSFSPASRELVLHGSTEKAAAAWLAEYGLVQKGYLPHMNLVFNPMSDVQYVAGTTEINTFRATDYMVQDPSTTTPSTLDEIPPVINKTIRSMMGDPSPEVLGHFINWLAYIFQTREKTGTAWVFNGVEGTGKGRFTENVLIPLFGQEQVAQTNFSHVNGEFNGFLEHSMFVVFQDADIKAAENSANLMQKLRTWITDSPLPIRKMRADTLFLDNYSNFILCTNERTPIILTSTDRRFTVCNRQEKKILYNPNELKILFDGDELEDFADMLLRWPVDRIAAHRIIDTEFRRDVHEATTSINQLVAEAVIEGNLEFFLERMPSESEAMADFFNRFNPIGMFKQLTDKYIAAAKTGQPLIVTDEELFVLFRTLIPDTRFFQDSKTWRKRHYKSLGLDVDKQHRVPGTDKRVRGVQVTWNLPENIDLPAPAEDNVVTIKTGNRKN